MKNKIKVEETLFNINEIYNSIEGEGVQAGKLTTFIRFAGCNLSCKWCDTKYALGVNRETKLMTVPQIMQKVKHTNITLTGGEPLFREGAVEFIQYLLDEGYNVNLETNGSLSIEPLKNLRHRERLTIMMDYKTRSSNGRPTTKMENFKCLKKQDAVKFVIASEADFAEFLEVWEQYIVPGSFRYLSRVDYKVFLSSCFQDIYPADLYKLQASGLEVTKYKKEYQERVRLQLQMHKYIWPPEQRGV